MAITRSKIGGTWSYSVYVPGCAKRMRGSTGTTDRAEAMAVEALVRMAAGRTTTRDRLLRMVDALYPVDPEQTDDVPLDALYIDLERAEELRGREVTTDNRARRRQGLRALAAWAKENWPAAKSLRSVDRRCAQGYAAWMARQGKGAKTVRNKVGVLQAVWNILKRTHDGLENPWTLAMPAPQRQNVRGAFSPEEVSRLFAAADAESRDWGLACRIAAATGLRMGDAITIRHGDIRDGVLHLEPGKTKKHGIRVSIPLPPALLARIGTGAPDEPVTPHLCAHYNGHYLYGTTQFAEIMAAAGVEPNGRTFHSFRHFFRTQLARAGVSDEIAMKLGGWTQRTTADRYDHDGRSKEKAAAVAAAWALTESQAD